MLRVLDLFSGIGGFSLGLERTGGFQTVAFCEIEEFPRRVLAKHWPGVPCYEDVRTLTADVLARDGITVDVITGGFPCQDLSVAGKRAGLDGERSGLWSEIVRLIGELRPQYVIVENVANLLSGPSEKRGGWFGRVLGDLAECGYNAEWENIPAAALGAPHRRERVWVVAYPEQKRPTTRASSIFRKTFACHQKWDGQERPFEFGPCWDRKNVADADEAGLEGGTQAGNTGGIWEGGYKFSQRRADNAGPAWALEPAVGRGLDGFSAILDRDLSNEAKERARKVLRDMRLCDDPQEVWQSAGGFDSVSQEEILLAFLCEYEDRKNTGRLAMDREEARQECLRGVWRHVEFARAPLQPQLSGQYFGEFANALRKLSRGAPSLYPQAWQNNLWEDGVPRVAPGVPNRVDRLGGLGNAVVPQIPELIGRAILEATR